MTFSPKKLTRAALFISFCFVSASCARFQRVAPLSTITTKAGTKIEQKAEAEIPASASSSQSQAFVSIPKGSALSIDAPSETSPGKISVSFAEKSELKLNSNYEKVSAAKTFAPEVGPTANELATAKGIELSYWLAGGLLLLCAGLAYTTHFKAAIIAGIAAVAAPILARFVSSQAGIAVAGIGLCIAATLYFAWYLSRRHPEILAEVKAEVKATSTLVS